MSTTTPGTKATPFICLLNAFEHASQDDSPAAKGYGEKRRAVLAYVATLEAEVSALRADLEHMRINAGEESCANYAIRNRELEAGVSTLRERVTALTQERERERDLKLRFIRDTVDGMECEPKRDSYGHEDTCPVANPEQAWRRLRERVRELEGGWVSVEERLPEAPEYSVTYAVVTTAGKVMALDWAAHKHAATERGRAPRWQWHGRNSLWTVTRWRPLPNPPAIRSAEEEKP